MNVFHRIVYEVDALSLELPAERQAGDTPADDDDQAGFSVYSP